MKKISYFFTVLLILSSCASTQTPHQLTSSSKISSTSFQGIWIGELENISGPSLTKEDRKRKLKIEVDGTKAVIYQWQSNQWVRLWRDRNISFYVASYATNAVIFAIASGNDTDCNWVETHTFNLTKLDENTAKAFHYRTVNNTSCKELPDHMRVWTTADSMTLGKAQE